ncbi:hypothetical protein Lalb_Chr13g0301871 [Lupinus albus]|uniref:DUF3119 family protein n=1 Tax=Lupinus albus TaxID=3870 RepID=A0A6A4PJX7_LUPAL|nr:hypothetical protein Lalb_Chr13g0301871 [Lupinus albus]
MSQNKGFSVKLVSTSHKTKISLLKNKQMATTLLSTHSILPSQRRERIECFSALRTSFCGQVLFNPYPNPIFCGRQIARSHESSFVVNSLLGFGRKVKRTRDTVIPEPDYRIPIALLGIAGGLAYTDNLVPAVPVGLLGLLLLFQTTRVRFVFDDESLEVKIGDQLQESGENVFVGGKNRWKYSTFVNWEFWWPNFPILVYFKETQTKPEGQIHFFPIIYNGKQLYDTMVERAGPSKTSGPKES